jgi:hypothetical protein
MTNDEQRLHEIRERANRATPGPWEWLQDERGFFVRSCYGANVATTGYDVCDTDFIANSRGDVGWLLSLVERLMEQRKAAPTVDEIDAAVMLYEGLRSTCGAGRNAMRETLSEFIGNRAILSSDTTEGAAT